MQTERLNRLAADSAAVFLAAVLCVYPLYIDKFSNLGVIKFTGVFTLFLLWCLWLGACRLIGARPRPGRLPRRDGTLLSLAAVTAATLLSTLCSLSPVASAWGLSGYYGGLMMALFTAAGYLAVRAFARGTETDGLILGMGLTSAVVTVLYVLNIFNIDLIGAYADTAVVERAQFFSTLGQKDFNAGYLALTLPPVFYAFLTARGRRRTAVYGVPAFVGGLSLAVVDAEGLLLGLAAAAMVLVCSREFTTRVLRRTAFLGMSFFFWAGLMRYMRQTVYTQGGTPLLAALGRMATAGFAVCALLWLALLLAERRFGKEWPLYRLGRLLTAAMLAGAALLFALANLWPGFPSLGRLDGLLVFNDDWGTGRGTAWRAAWCTWLDGSLWRKLVGVGPGMMHAAVARWAGESITPTMRTFYAAHNEYLEQLLTTGLLGLAAWLWFLASHLRRAVRGWSRPGVAPVTLALVSYLAHAAVSIRVSMIFPEVMLLFGLLAALTAPEPAAAVSAGPAPAAPRGRRKSAAPAPEPHRPAVRLACLAAVAVLSMAAAGALSRLLFAFLLG